jgi:hypothetical protein
MSAEYAHLDGRHWVNDDFVKAVQDLYPATTFNMPLGFRTYVGWTGKDEVWFTEHDEIEGIDGPTYEVMFEPDHPEAFTMEMLDKVDHQVKKAFFRDPLDDWRQQRELIATYGETIEEARERKGMTKQARRGQGLYGYTKGVQKLCERSATRLQKSAAMIMRRAMRKNEAVAHFLAEHATRGSLPANILVQACSDSMPKLAVEKVAKGKHWGMYGYPVKVANLGMKACGEIRQAAGILAANLHRRRAEQHGTITGFFNEHHGTGKCGASGLIATVYPARDWRYKMAMGPKPQTIEEWLAWDPPDLV